MEIKTDNVDLSSLNRESYKNLFVNIYKSFNELVNHTYFKTGRGRNKQLSEIKYNTKVIDEYLNENLNVHLNENLIREDFQARYPIQGDATGTERPKKMKIIIMKILNKTNNQYLYKINLTIY